MRYGLPYQGSKSAIAEWIVNQLPDGDVFVDLFCGGGAVTHYAMMSRKYQQFIMNDIDGRLPILFCDCAYGKYTTKTHPEWISREVFNQRKADDAYIALVWSFSNNGTGYLYGADIEAYKHAYHILVFDGDAEPMRQFGIDLKMCDFDDAFRRYSYYSKQIKNFWPNKHGEISKLIQEHNRLYLSTCYCIMDYPQEITHVLRPIPEIQQEIDAITQLFAPNTIGVHIRRTDNKASISGSPTTAFIDAMKKELETDNKVHFFVATDDTSVRTLLQNTFPGRIITQEFHKCHRDTLSGMKQAVVDLFCLARTTKIIGSYWSSFTDTAAEIGNTPLLIAGRENAV